MKSKVKTILQSEEPVLREIAKEVDLKNIKTPKVVKMLKDMSEALDSQYDGVAIAAPQIGYSYRIFLVSGKIFEKSFIRGKKTENTEHVKNLVFINPVITKLSKEKDWVPEGCLSVRPVYGKTYRAKKATVEAYDEEGNKFSRGGSGLLAQIFQHETDHLNGILFIDHAKELRIEDLP
ncbi:MAG: peptide deformylase [Candidatus Paceibacterota bacterium]